MLIVSPYVKPHVDHTVYQFGSILRFIEETWNLGSLGKNDAHSTSIGNAFDFNMAPRKFHIDRIEVLAGLLLQSSHPRACRPTPNRTELL